MSCGAEANAPRFFTRANAEMAGVELSAPAHASSSAAPDNSVVEHLNSIPARCDTCVWPVRVTHVMWCESKCPTNFHTRTRRNGRCRAFGSAPSDQRRACLQLRCPRRQRLRVLEHDPTWWARGSLLHRCKRTSYGECTRSALCLASIRACRIARAWLAERAPRNRALVAQLSKRFAGQRYCCARDATASEYRGCSRAHAVQKLAAHACGKSPTALGGAGSCQRRRTGSRWRPELADRAPRRREVSSALLDGERALRDPRGTARWCQPRACICRAAFVVR